MQSNYTHKTYTNYQRALIFGLLTLRMSHTKIESRLDYFNRFKFQFYYFIFSVLFLGLC